MIMITNKKIRKSLIVIFYTASIAIQILVILKVIPYKWVNGGMSQSYEIQAVQSIISIIISSGLFVFVLQLMNQGIITKSWKLKILYLITLFWSLGLFMQIAGTAFSEGLT
jgi:predicted membrane protein